MLILNGMNLRVWEGVTTNGVRFIALIKGLQALDPTTQMMMVQELAKAKDPDPNTEPALIQMGVVPAPPAAAAAE
jgi:hypothetical protein